MARKRPRHEAQTPRVGDSKNEIVNRVNQTATAGTLSAHVLLRVVEFCKKRGVDPDRLCEDAGTNLQHLRAPDARVPYATVAQLGQLALEATNEPNFGLLLAQDVEDPENFDVGLLVLMASADVRAALNRFIDHQRYWGDGDRATLHEVEDGIFIRYALAGAQGEYARHSHECALAEIVLGIRTLTGQPLRPTHIRFPHPKPSSTAEHERIFCCPIEFCQPAAEVALSNDLLHTKLPHANATFLSIFERQLDAALARLPSESSVSNTVREAARAALAGGNCTLTDTARVLGMSSRTLQRHLRAEGTSFAEVIDALRRELALAYVRKRMPIVDVAHLLGYADTTAFHHAFQRWTGTSPARYE